MGKKITQLATITEVADDDLIVGVDVSDTSGSENGTNKKFTKQNLLKEINSRAGDIESAVANILNLVYPVGTIYETTSTDLDTTTKMGNHFGGTWEAYGSGRVLVAKSADTEFDTIGETGGAKTHTLTIAEMPSHNHLQYTLNHAMNGGSDASLRATYNYVQDTGTSSTGGGEAHNNLQPYIVVYRYRRVS